VPVGAGQINAAEARSVYALLLAFLACTVVAVVLGIKGKHLELMARVPFLWQSFVPVVLLSTAFTFSRTLRSGLRLKGEQVKPPV